MASYFDGRLDPGTEDMRIVSSHQETVKQNPLVRSSLLSSNTSTNQIPNGSRYRARLFSSQRLRNLLCFSTAKEHQTMLSTNDSIFQTTKPLFTPLRQSLPQIKIQDIAGINAEQLSRSEGTTLRAGRDAYEDGQGCGNEKTLEDTILDSDIHMRHTRNTGECADTPNLLRLYPSQTLLAIESDRCSTSSGDSEDSNEFNAIAKVQGAESIELLASVDTQSPDNVIFRPTLDKLVDCKEHDVPKERIKTIQSPLDPQKSIKLKKFVRLQLYFDQINLPPVEVELKIVEVPEEPNGFQVILGRRFIRMYQLEDGRNPLLEQVVVANRQRPKTKSRSFGPFRYARRSKEQKKIDEAEIKAMDEEKRQAHAKLYPKIPKDDTAGSSTQTGSSKGSRMGDRGVNSSAESPANFRSRGTVYDPSPIGQPAVQQSSHQSIAQWSHTTDWRIQRTDTASSRSTQSSRFTDYSFHRADTWGSASSNSSWSGMSAYTLKEGEPASQLEAQQGSIRSWKRR